MGLILTMFIEFVDWLTGRKARREEREAYMAALAAVVDASKAQSQMLETWFQSFSQAAQTPQKGWTMTDREQWLEEFKQDRPDVFAGMPPAIADDPKAIEEWLGEEIMNL